MTTEQYRKQWLRFHKIYERRAFNILRKMFKQITLDLPFDELTEQNYPSKIELSVKQNTFINAYWRLYTTIGLLHGTRVGRSIDKDIKDFSLDLFQNNFRFKIYNWILENAGFRITSVRAEYIEYIKQLIANGLQDGKTIREISKEIVKLVRRRSFYGWQAMRIARTETTAAANQGAVLAGESSGIVWNKIWISALDNRTRRHPDDKFDHREMHEVQVRKEDYFKLTAIDKNGSYDEYIEFPGAPITRAGNQTSAGNVINCRCTVSVIAARDSNGRIIRRI